MIPRISRSLRSLYPQRWSARDAARAAVNVGTLVLAVVLAYLVRFDWQLSAAARDSLFRCLALMVPWQAAVIIVADLHRRSIRGVTRVDLWRIVQAVTAGTLLAGIWSGVLDIAVPRSIWIIDWLLAISLLGGTRVLACEIHERLQRRATDASPCLLVGTCLSSEAIIRTINGSPAGGRRIVGIVAPNTESHLVGRSAVGVPVIGTVESLERAIESYRVKEVLLVSGALVGRQVRAVENRCRAAGCRVQVIPVIQTLVDGGLHVQPRSLDIADLLKREPVDIDLDGICSWVSGATVLVTGAAGSIGSEICRQVAKHGPARILLVDRNENGLFWLERELQRLDSAVEFVPCVADITDPRRMDAIVAEHRPRIVFHAAAYKHVPLMEQHPGEAVKNIPLATVELARVAARHAVETFVLISTDKAVNPTSVMGACKRVAELLVQALGSASETKFVAVRFGNVLDSAGSVVPLFREQILRGGPVTVTHPDIERFFMTIPEAARLVLQAGHMGRGGEVFVLDMGEPVRIADLARDMIRLSNLTEGRDIEIHFTGLRPGEKLYEELYDEAGESPSTTLHPKILAVRPGVNGLAAPADVVESLRRVADGPADIVRHLLTALVPGYRGPLALPPAEAIAGRIGPQPADAGERRDEAA
jgi:FlaA1/EpsC-like NDP-sugar epimerase